MLPDTEAAVRGAIESTGYIHDTIARSLVTDGTMTVGVAMSAISNPYFADVLYAIERAVSLAGYSLLLVDTHDNSHKERHAVASLLSRRVDAVILAPSSDPSLALATVARATVCTVLLGVDQSPGVAQCAISTQSTALALARGGRRAGARRML